MHRLALLLAAVCGLAVAVVPALAADQTVTTSGTSFAPDEVAVRPGEKVTIHNGGMGYHDLNWADGAPGQPVEAFTDWSTERTFTDPGEYVFYCDVHGSPDAGMRGTVYVSDAGTVPSGGGGETPPPGTTTTSTAPGTTSAPPPPPGEPTPPAAQDTTPPGVTVLRRRVRRRGVKVRLELSEAATVVLKVRRRSRRVARRTFEAEAGEVVLRVRRRLRRGRYTLRLVVEDAAGNASRRTVRARVG